MHPDNIDMHDYLVKVLVVTIWAVLTTGLIQIVNPSCRYLNGLNSSRGLEKVEYTVLPLLIRIHTC